MLYCRSILVTLVFVMEHVSNNRCNEEEFFITVAYLLFYLCLHCYLTFPRKIPHRLLTKLRMTFKNYIKTRKTHTNKINIKPQFNDFSLSF